MTKEEFVKEAYAAAMQSSELSGMPALVTTAQAALESNWGRSCLSREANNYFGIKARVGQDQIVMRTKECEKGKQIVIAAAFTKYPSMLECFCHRDRIIAKSALYASARKKFGDEAGFIQEIARHWATDPKYAEKLIAVLREVKKMLQ